METKFVSGYYALSSVFERFSVRILLLIPASSSDRSLTSADLHAGHDFLAGLATMIPMNINEITISGKKKTEEHNSTKKIRNMVELLVLAAPS